MHFNHIRIDNCEHIFKDASMMSDGEECSVKIRYGVINMDDMLRDLQYWESLMTSSFL